jgi:D-alanine transaminase
VFGVIDGVIVTAAADHRILHGITRELVLELARADGLRVDERDWTLDELFGADEVFMTSTTAGPRAIVEVDRRPIGTGRSGPVIERLQRLYCGLVASLCGP